MQLLLLIFTLSQPEHKIDSSSCARSKSRHMSLSLSLSLTLSLSLLSLPPSLLFFFTDVTCDLLPESHFARQNSYKVKKPNTINSLQKARIAAHHSTSLFGPEQEARPPFFPQLKIGPSGS